MYIKISLPLSFLQIIFFHNHSRCDRISSSRHREIVKKIGHARQYDKFHFQLRAISAARALLHMCPPSFISRAGTSLPSCAQERGDTVPYFEKIDRGREIRGRDNNEPRK